MCAKILHSDTPCETNRRRLKDWRIRSELVKFVWEEREGGSPQELEEKPEWRRNREWCLVTRLLDATPTHLLIPTPTDILLLPFFPNLPNLPSRQPCFNLFLAARRYPPAILSCNWKCALWSLNSPSPSLAFARLIYSKSNPPRKHSECKLWCRLLLWGPAIHASKEWQQNRITDASFIGPCATNDATLQLTHPQTGLIIDNGALTL